MYPGIGIGINRSTAGGFDSSAQAYFSALSGAGFPLEPSEQIYVNRLVTDLKAAGLWSKMKAIYPMVSSQRNLLNYSNMFDSAFWTKNNSNVIADPITTPTGQQGYFWSDDPVNTQHRLYISETTNNIITASIYVKYLNRQYFGIRLYNTLGTKYSLRLFDIQNGTLGASLDSGITSTATITSVGSGWYRITLKTNAVIDNSNLLFFMSNSNTITDAGGTTYSGNGSGFYISSAQLELSNTATVYQNVTGVAQSIFVDQFKFNLKDPRNLNAAYRLLWTGGWVYSNTGALPNGTNAYADTSYNESVDGVLSNEHISYYSKTSGAINAVMGASSGANETNIYPNLGGTFYFRVQKTNSGVATVLDSKAFFIANRTDANTVSGFRNEVKSSLSSLVGSSVARNIYIGGNNDVLGTSYTNALCAFSSIGLGLTDTEASNFYTIVQRFQTSLGRQEGLPQV